MKVLEGKMVKIDLRCKCGARWHGNIQHDMVGRYIKTFASYHTRPGCTVRIVLPRANTGA